MRSVLGHRGDRSDAGFTLIELVVALTILSVGIVGVIGVTNGSFRVAGGASGRSKMIALTTKEVEALRAIPYGSLATASEFTACASPPPGVSVCREVNRTVTNNGLTYTLEKTITKPTAESGNDQHYDAIVAVTWTDPTGVHEVHQTTYLYPGGIGPASGNVTSTTSSGSCTPDMPGSLNVTKVLDGGTVQSTNSLDLRWSAPTSGCQATSYVIQYKTLGSELIHEITRLATTTEYRVTGLSAGTTYSFQIASRSASGRQSGFTSWVSMATDIQIGSTCKIGTITVTPSGVHKKNAAENSNLDEPALVKMPVTGTCASYDITYKKGSLGGSVTSQMTYASGSYSATVTATGPWDVGSRYIDIFVRGTTTRVGSVLFTVCEHNVRVCE